MSKRRLLLTAPILAALAIAGNAQEHTGLVLASPAANAAVSKPGRVVPTFNERVVATPYARHLHVHREIA